MDPRYHLIQDSKWFTPAFLFKEIWADRPWLQRHQLLAA
jgi:hypothetical protein